MEDNDDEISEHSAKSNSTIDECEYYNSLNNTTDASSNDSYDQINKFKIDLHKNNPSNI